MFQPHLAVVKRASDNSVRALSQRVLSQPLVVSMLEAMPGIAVILSPDNQVVAANSRALQAFGVGIDQVIGFRIGDLLGCVQADGACGSRRCCSFCPASSTISQSQSQRESASRECSLVVGVASSAHTPVRTEPHPLTEHKREGVIEAEVIATPIEVDGLSLTVVALRDVSAENRRALLERVFFHDVLDTAGGLRGLAELLTEMDDPVAEKLYKGLLVDLADRLVDTISDQRQLLAAEAGDLETNPAIMSVNTVWRCIESLYSRLDAANGRKIVVVPTPAIEVETDIKLLQRVLGNMVKNALEASPPGATVSLSAREEKDLVEFSVHNEGVIPETIQHQIFHRSFSTKGRGRGIGTHSMKLLGEQYLHGKVSFVSNAKQGTVFLFRIPRVWSG